ncbi:MAG: LysR family transcriptional regulator [Myxococcota bacterium]
MPSTDRLGEFVAVAEAGSVSEAARTLGVPRATLSRRLTGMEAELGVRLLHRQTRRLILTEAGERLLARARGIVAEVEAAWAEVSRLDDTPRGRLRVSIPPSEVFYPSIVSFSKRHPQVDVDIFATPESLDLVASGVDVAIRFSAGLDTGLIARRLDSDRVVAAMSPRYAEASGRPRTLADLAQHACIGGPNHDRHGVTSWPLLAGGSVEVRGSFCTNEVPLQLRATLDGLGIALLPGRIVQTFVERGHLELVLPDEIGTQTGAFLVYPERDFLPPQVRAFIDHVVEHHPQTVSAARSAFTPERFGL